MFKNKEKRPVTKGKGKGHTPKQKRFVDSMDSMKHLSPEMQERMRELEDGGMEKEELEETARKFLAHPIGKKDDSGETAEELARLAQADLERQRLEEEAAAAEAKKQREIAEAKAAAEAAAAARIAAAAREKARDDVIVAIFNRLDTDASGGVSIAELVKAMRRDNTLAFTLGLADRHLSQTDGTMDKIAALFYEFDDDQGGQLSVNEFAKLIKSAPELVVPHSMQAEARAARFEGQIADVFDVRAFAKGIMKRVVKNAHRDARRSGAADSDASSDSDASDASDSETSSESSSSASPPPESRPRRGGRRGDRVASRARGEGRHRVHLRLSGQGRQRHGNRSRDDHRCPQGAGFGAHARPRRGTRGPGGARGDVLQVGRKRRPRAGPRGVRRDLRPEHRGRRARRGAETSG